MGLIDDDDDDDNLPTTDRMIKTWGAGVIGALVIASYASTRIATQTATWMVGWRRGRQTIEIQGPAAVGLGIFYLGIATLLHLHYFWAWRKRFHGLGHVGKIGSLVAMIIGMFTFLYHTSHMWRRDFF